MESATTPNGVDVDTIMESFDESPYKVNKKRGEMQELGRKNMEAELNNVEMGLNNVETGLNNVEMGLNSMETATRRKESAA